MPHRTDTQSKHRDDALSPLERADWLDALSDLLQDGPRDTQKAHIILRALTEALEAAGAAPFFKLNSDYVNTIHHRDEPPYPGNYAFERKIKSLIRWNAMAMVVRANRETPGIGGHLATYASAATLYEVAYTHFFRGQTDTHPGDLVYFQGHASPGIYARAFLEGRLSETDLTNFRRELSKGGGLSSYPHPYLMPTFWQFPTVSMGLGPLSAIYQARFMRYLTARGLIPESDARVWAFLGDGECDEPETLSALSLAGREKLDNLMFVVNCNLQRLDGPVRGNGKIIQELERLFLGADWNVMKVIWGGDWDALLDADIDGRLRTRMMETCDGDYQTFSVDSGAAIREHFFGRDPELLARVAHLSDDELKHLTRGGHDSRKVFAAYERAMQTRGKPSVVLAKTIKGYGLGSSGEGQNIAHGQKNIAEADLARFRDRFELPISDRDLTKLPFIKLPDDAPEMRYLRESRKRLGGDIPSRRIQKTPLPPLSDTLINGFHSGSADRAVSTTMAFVSLVSSLLRNPTIGKQIVPIVSDEARTFGMESLFRQVGIYAEGGQHYRPVDHASLISYVESERGQILEEGITEAGAMASFIAAGTSYATFSTPMIPFFIFYSMFGFQRIADLIWSAGDSRARGFLLGATAGKTTLQGEGLQHNDGHSPLIASAFPHILAYDAAYAYEVAEIIAYGYHRLYELEEDRIVYLTLYNETYPQRALDLTRREDIVEGIRRGMYCLEPSDAKNTLDIRILAAGPIVEEAVHARKTLIDAGYTVELWSVTSFSELRHEAIARGNNSHLVKSLHAHAHVTIAATDYDTLVSDQLAPWIPGLISLGANGFGKSDTRRALRRYFNNDAQAIVEAATRAIEHKR